MSVLMKSSQKIALNGVPSSARGMKADRRRRPQIIFLFIFGFFCILSLFCSFLSIVGTPRMAEFGCQRTNIIMLL